VNDDLETRIAALAEQHRFSVEAVTAIFQALAAGNGRQAQWNHPELGGMGQWMPGMCMIGAMNDARLKARVERICADCVGLVARSEAAPVAWWPAVFGRPSAEGSQGRVRYAIFPVLARLVVEINGRISVRDTTGSVIRGVSQQSGASCSVVFDTLDGPRTVDDFPEIAAS